MSDEDWENPYAEEITEITEITEVSSIDEIEQVKTDIKTCDESRSEIAKILETKSTHIYDFKNIRISIQDLYQEGIVPFDFSTPSPDDLWRLQKKQTIIRKK